MGRLHEVVSHSAVRREETGMTTYSTKRTDARDLTVAICTAVGFCVLFTALAGATISLAAAPASGSQHVQGTFHANTTADYQSAARAIAPQRR
jgi:hypothetical protein